MPCPLVKSKQAVDVLRHHHASVQFDIWEVLRNRKPAFLNDFAQIIQVHFAVYDFSEKALLVFSADGYEVDACL